MNSWKAGFVTGALLMLLAVVAAALLLGDNTDRGQVVGMRNAPRTVRTDVPQAAQTAYPPVAPVVSVVAAAPTAHTYHYPAPFLPPTAGPTEVAMRHKQSQLIELLYGMNGEVIAHSSNITNTSESYLRELGPTHAYLPFGSKDDRLLDGYIIQQVSLETPLEIGSPSEFTSLTGVDPLREQCHQWPCIIKKAWRLTFFGGYFGTGLPYGNSATSQTWSFWADGNYTGKGIGELKLSLLLLDPTTLHEGAHIGVKSEPVYGSTPTEPIYFREPLHFSKALTP